MRASFISCPCRLCMTHDSHSPSLALSSLPLASRLSTSPKVQLAQPTYLQLLGFAHQRPPDLQNLPTVLLCSCSRALSSSPSSPALDHGKLPKLHPFGHPVYSPWTNAPLMCAALQLLPSPFLLMTWLSMVTTPLAWRRPRPAELLCALSTRALRPLILGGRPPP
ncbi:hypothetical protein GOP47_0026928 [Adiantum capillus-veneris]|nr:hypothetical protein GOP47_0026928 [Adiantum capillus-veneris]